MIPARDAPHLRGRGPLHEYYRNDSPGRLSVDVYFRPTVTLETRQSTVERLEELHRRGTIRELSIDSMPDRVNLDSVSETEGIVSMYDRFDRWARANDVELTPAFAVSAATSTVWGETRRQLHPPVVCMVVRCDSTIVGVFPHSTAHSHRSVADALDHLAVDRLAAVLPESVEYPPPPADACPECGAPLANAQGVLACYECNWDERAAQTGHSRRSTEPDLIG